ncbi:MAG: flagellar type III secretion system pore protein FliP, partial [Hyphomicrobiales bacterium]|nr:flagellar type III secretion system pore protein FliP [Hyphomicrobiales bacterium]
MQSWCRGPARRLLPVAIFGAIALAAGPATAQDITLGFGEGTTLSERAVQLVLLITVLSLAPSILVMVTSFTRIVVVLSLLRTAIGLQTAPPNAVVISLALFLTAFVMAPTFQASYENGVQPFIDGDLTPEQAFEQAAQPIHAFMRKHVREKDLQLFVDLSGEPAPENPEDVSLRVLVPAFMISELKRAFEIGFLLFVPFIIIDLVVA